MDEIIVKPVTTILDRVMINAVTVNLGISAYITVTVFGSEASYTIPLLMEGEAYQNWGDSDVYLENWVLAQLGLERA